MTGFPSGSAVKNPLAVYETQKMWLQSLGWEDLLEQGTATHSSILDWRIPMDRGAWWAGVHRVAKSGTRPSDLAHTHAGLKRKMQRWCPPVSALGSTQQESHAWPSVKALMFTHMHNLM